MKNCLCVLSTTLAGFLFFSNFSSIVAMKNSGMNSLESSKDSNLDKCFLYNICHTFDSDDFRGLIKELEKLGFMKNESVIKASLLHVLENLDKIRYIKHDNFCIYTLDCNTENKLGYITENEICLMIEFATDKDEIKIFPGLGKVNIRDMLNTISPIRGVYKNSVNLIELLIERFAKNENMNVSSYKVVKQKAYSNDAW